MGAHRFSGETEYCWLSTGLLSGSRSSLSGIKSAEGSNELSGDDVGHRLCAGATNIEWHSTGGINFEQTEKDNSLTEDYS